MVARKPHTYEIGDVLNDSLKVLNKIRTGKDNQRAYEVQSTTYPEAPTYIITENSVNKGIRDAYLDKKRIFEGNSLYSEEWVRPYLTDLEQAKTIAPKTANKITFKCPECGHLKVMSPHKFMSRGLKCPFCSKGTSYPELFMMSYLEIKGIDYEYQKRFYFLYNRLYDFYIPSLNLVIEVHGEQHYSTSRSSKWETYDTIDEEKENYLKENGIDLVTIDCRESEFEFIRKSINSTKVLENIYDYEEQAILKHISLNRTYPTKEIIKKYKQGESTIVIGKEYNLNKGTINSILRKNNIERRKSNNIKVKCINTGEVFETKKEAYEWCGLKSCSGITSVCKGTRSTAGKHPETKEKLYWEYFIN